MSMDHVVGRADSNVADTDIHNVDVVEVPKRTTWKDCRQLVDLGGFGCRMTPHCLLTEADDVVVADRDKVAVVDAMSLSETWYNTEDTHKEDRIEVAKILETSEALTCPPPPPLPPWKEKIFDEEANLLQTSPLASSD
jgi:hypothetical protein